MSFALNLVRLRTEARYTPADLAAWTRDPGCPEGSVSERAIRQLESGQGNPTLRVLASLGWALECSPNDLIGEEWGL